MKSIILSIALILILSAGYSQDGSYVKLGVQAGGDLTWIYERGGGQKYSGQDFNSTFGYNANLYIRLQGKSVFGVSAEPGIIRKGSDVDYLYGGAIAFSDSYKLTYVTVPLMVNLRIAKFISAGIGLEAGYIVKSLPVDYFKKFELSGIAGMDINLSRHFDIALRYSSGITPIYKIEAFADNVGNEIPNSELSLRNQVIQLSVRYFILRGAN